MTLDVPSGGWHRVGLVIAKRTASRKMHGEIGLDSQTGEGSEFCGLPRDGESPPQAVDDLLCSPTAEEFRAAVTQTPGGLARSRR